MIKNFCQACKKKAKKRMVSSQEKIKELIKKITGTLAMYENIRESSLQNKLSMSSVVKVVEKMGMYFQIDSRVLQDIINKNSALGDIYVVEKMLEFIIIGNDIESKKLLQPIKF